MKFSITSDLPAHGARLFVCTDTCPCSADNTNREAELLCNGLTADEHFAAARIAQADRLADFAVLRLPVDGKRSTWEKSIQEAASWAAKQENTSLILTGLNDSEARTFTELAVAALGAAVYRFDRFKSEAKPTKLQEAVLVHPDTDGLASTLQQAEALLYGVTLCKDLGNAAPNICTPTYLAETAKTEAEALGAKVKILDRDYIRDNMGAFWSVAKGSAEEPKLIELSYFGAADKNAAPIVLVGKGITFDTGGISLKPADSMDEMKYDMCGAASVIGTFIAAAKAKLPLNLIALVPTCENMPDAAASKPGDIVKAMNGTSIEILNTDAEGRLILCDALTYAERFQPHAVIDVATLTGACVIALGNVASGLLSNKQQLADSLLAAAEVSGDKTWQLPLFEEYKEQLKSNFADLQNIGGRAAGTITAATFLAHFAQNYDWAHLDIAGTAWKSGKEKGATGRPVPLLWQYLKNLSAQTA